MVLTTNTALFILRIALAAVFLKHGTNKLKKWKSMPNFMKFIGVAETAGAAGVLLGVYSGLAATGLAIIMAGAIYLKITKWNIPFSTEKGTGWELDLVLLAAALIIAAAGPGAYPLGLVLGLPY